MFTDHASHQWLQTMVQSHAGGSLVCDSGKHTIIGRLIADIARCRYVFPIDGYPVYAADEIGQ